MPSKHINDQQWRQIERKTLEAINETQVIIKAEDMLKWLISKGLEEITEADYARYRNEKHPGIPG